MRFGVVALLAMMLSGCLGSPEVPLRKDVELANEAPGSGPMAVETKAPETASPKLQSVGSIADVPPAVTDSAKPRRGLAALFGRRNRRLTDAPPRGVSQDAAANVAPVAENAAENLDAKALPKPETQTSRRGLRGLFGKRNRDANPDPNQVIDRSVADSEDVVENPAGADDKMLVASAGPAMGEAPRRQRSGLFGPRRAKTSQFTQAVPSVMLPFGQIGLACGVRGRALGKEVDRFPEHGRGYRLFDTKPATTGPRTHYITGFKDGCARQFTASLALLDSPVLHEQLLEVGSSQSQHSTNADRAFQKIRSKVCRIGKGKACPEKRVDEMEKTMAFVTTYERFGGNASWNEILLHNGVVAAY